MWGGSYSFLFSLSFSLYHPHPWRKMKTSLSLHIFVQLWSIAASRTPKQPLAQQMVRDLARPREIRRPRLRWFVSLCPSFCAADGAAQTVVPFLAQTFISMTSRWHHFHAYLRVHDFFCLFVAKHLSEHERGWYNLQHTKDAYPQCFHRLLNKRRWLFYLFL